MSSAATMSSWQESLTNLSSLLQQQQQPISNKAITNSSIEKNCRAFLLFFCLEALDDDEDTPPREVTALITTIYLRSLIKGGKYSTVVDYCRSLDNNNEYDNNNGASSSSLADYYVEELAYSLYRLRKYEACRKLCEDSLTAANNGGDGDGGSSNKRRGLVHIYAQTLYRLGETIKVDEVYRQLFENDNNPAEMDIDEKEDSLANALANKIANYTPSSELSKSSSSSWLEKDEMLQQLLTSYGHTSSSTLSAANNNDDDEEVELLQNYDLAYNLATYLLLSYNARPTSNLLNAKCLLEHAEKSALTIFDSSSNAMGGDGEEKKVNEEEKEEKRRQKEVAERESGPIRANLALSKLLLGGDTNITEAMRGYLILITTHAMAQKQKNKGSSSGSSGAAGEGNLMATASNNLAVLRDGKESVFDIVKRIPVTSSLSVSDEAGGKDKGGASSSSTTAIPLVGATPQQVRIALYNRALLYAKMGNVSGCLDTLNVLRSSLSFSYHGDDVKGTKSGGEGSSSSPKRTKGKKKKGGAATGAGAVGNNVTEDVPTAKPASDVEVIAWNARADLLESELYRITSESSSKDSKSHEDILKGALHKINGATINDGSAAVLSFAQAQLLLHQAMVNNDSKGAAAIKSYIDALESDSFPTSITSSPGMVATLISLYASLNNDKAVRELIGKHWENLGDDGYQAELALAEFWVERGEYKTAESILSNIVDTNSDSMVAEGRLEAIALLVKVYSYTDPAKAEEYVEVLQDAMGGGVSNDDLDGEALETMDVPRFAKKEMSSSSGSSSSKVRKMIAVTGGKGRSNMGGERKKNHREAILHKRAKQREAYLSRLESEGKYDPNKIPLAKPDPERWIPKSQRSYNRRGRGRRGGGGGVGAQGGGAGAGMEKDALKLDVAARVAAKASGADMSGGKPSTANIKVSSSGATRKGKGGKRR